MRTLQDLGRLLRVLRRRHARLRRGGELTYRELAARTGWSPSAIAEYLTGRTLPPTDRFDALVGLLGATPAEQGTLATARDRVEEQQRRAPRPSGGGPGPGAAAAPVPRQLPPDVRGFAGRRDELARLDALLATAPRAAPSAVAISAVSGTAGIGKTALVVHWAHRVADRFPDGQLYVNLRGFDPAGRVMAPAEAVCGFLDALGVPPDRIPPSLDTQAALYRSTLTGRRVLVVLDNARDAEQVRPLLPGTPTALALVTSRSQLTPLVAIDGAQPLPLGQLSRAEAGEMLARRLGTDRVAAEPDAVEQIVSACSRLPLALAITAARAQQTGFPLGVLAAELAPATRLDALDAGDAVTRVRAVFSWSYAALTADAARLFRCYGLHAGPDISAAAAASLAALPPSEVRPLLAELTGANLLVEHLPGRYACHDLLRVYAAELARAHDTEDERHAAVTRLLDHYLHTGHTAALLLAPARDPIALDPPRPGVAPERPADYAQALAWFTAEHRVLLAAVDRAASGWDAHTWRLGWVLDDVLDRRGYWHDQAAVGRAAVAAAGRLADTPALARAHRYLAYAYLRLERGDDARAELGHAFELYRASGDLTGQAHTCHNLAMLWERQGDYARSLDHDLRALELYRAAGHRQGQATALNSAGWSHALLGDYPRALVYCEQALALQREFGNRDGQAATWDSLGYVHHQLGRYAEALDCYRQALDLRRTLGNPDWEAASLTRIGDTHLAIGDLAAARTAWTRALEILTELNHPDADDVRVKLDGIP